MQEQRIEDQDRDDRVSPRSHEKTVLGLLLSDSMPWSLSELVREFDGDRLGIEDSLAELTGRGLVHRLGEFAFPTVAARRLDEIGLD
jgi:hypothetical protein